MLRYLAPLLCVVACADPSRGVAIDRVVPDRAEVDVAQPVTIEGTFHVLTSNLDQGDTTVALVTAAVDTVPLANTTWLSEGQVTAMMPPLAEGVYDVTVSIDGRSATLADGYIVGNPPVDGGSATGTHTVTVIGPVTGGPHASFPLLVDLQDTRLATIANGGEVIDDDGSDIFFSLDQTGAMMLSHEIEKYTPDGELVVWVKIPSLDASTTFFIHAGSPAPQPSNPADVWTEGYGAVWHMGVLTDSTGHGNNATDGGTVGVDPNGQIEEARSFNGVNSAATVQPSATINDIFLGGGTLEVWVLATSLGGGNFGRAIDRGIAGNATLLARCDANGVASSMMFGRQFSTQGSQFCTPPNSVISGWNHVVIVYDDSSPANVPTLFVNGQPQSLTTQLSPVGNRTADTAPLVIGNRTNGDRGWAGSIDELRLSNVPRTRDWIQTTFDNQNDPNTFVILGP
jgi:hypothetical protein